MKSLKEALVHKHMDSNPFGLIKKDLIGDLRVFPMGVVVRMMEEQEKQRNKSNIKVFQNLSNQNKVGGGFNWDDSEAGYDFWSEVIGDKNFNLFFKKYSKYKKYNL